MARRLLVISYRWVFAVLAIAAIIVAFVHRMAVQPPGSAANFFSFFTVQSNIIAAAVSVVGAVPGRLPAARWYDLLRGAATMYMSVTGVVYALLLSDVPAGVDSTIPWVNEVLHYLMPLVVFLDWLLVPPRSVLKFRHAIVWAAFPLGYAAYTLIRGAAAHWYPYPFLNAALHGYGRVGLNCVGVGIGAALFIAATVWLGNAMQADGRPNDAQTA